MSFFAAASTTKKINKTNKQKQKQPNIQNKNKKSG